MRTLPTGRAKVKAFYATLHDASGVLGKVGDEILFFGDDGSITAYDAALAPHICVLGETSIADCQQVMDRLHGGAVGVCLTRRQEVR
jgi:hypothetical protein